jgi:hypothetical protein
MPSSGMLRRVALVRMDVSEEHIMSIRVIRFGELGTTLAVTINRSTLRRNAICYSNTILYYVVYLLIMLRLLATANVHGSPILVTLVI